jgi:hypothetical protein
LSVCVIALCGGCALTVDAQMFTNLPTGCLHTPIAMYDIYSPTAGFLA